MQVPTAVANARRREPRTGATDSATPVPPDLQSRMVRRLIVILLAVLALPSLPLSAQTRDDYERALALRDTLPGLV